MESSNLKSPLSERLQIQHSPAQMQPHSQRKKAVLFTNINIIGQVLFQSGMKSLQNEGVRFLDICFISFSISTIMAFIVLKYYNKSAFKDIKTWQNIKDLGFRTLFGLISVNTSVLAVFYIPLFMVSLIQSTNAFWASMLGFAILGDTMLRQELTGLVVGYLGIFFIVFFGRDTNMDAESTTNYMLGTLFAIANAIAIGCILVFLRKAKEMHYSVVQFSYSLAATAVMALILIAEFFMKGMEFQSLYSLRQYCLIVLFSTINGVAMLFLTMACQIEKAGIVGMIEYIVVFYSFLSDILIFHSSFQFIQVLGGVLVLAVNVYVGCMKLKREKEDIDQVQSTDMAV